MSITATAGLASLEVAAANAPPNAADAQTEQAPAPSVNSGEDTVQLTVSQQVYQLYNQGQQVSQIAASLNLTVAAVNSYLNLLNSSAGS
jgi:DNA-binding NarL/FixJ family response regulator